MLPVLMLGLLGLAACGASTPVTAASILQSASSANIKDMSFTMVLDTVNSSQELQASGSGKLTKKPSRAQFDLTLTEASTHLTVSVITDAATNTGYLKFSGASLPGFPSGKWTKVPGVTASAFGTDTSTFTDFSSLKNTTLLGGETLNSVAVWHIHAAEPLYSTPAVRSTPTATVRSTPGAGDIASVDFYFRKDNSYPVKAVITSTGADKQNLMVNFTAINSGITITLPSAAEVQTLP
jgi:hypothetical protein